MSITFSYEGERLVDKTEMQKYNGEWEKSSKLELTYSGENALAKMYSGLDGDWELIRDIEMILKNNLLLETTTNYTRDDEWEDDDTKIIYQYSGNDLLSYQIDYYDKENNEVYNSRKTDYVYLNGKLSERQGYQLDDLDNWVLTDLDSLIYSGDLLTSSIQRSKSIWTDSWVQATKYKYLYSGSDISNITVYMHNYQNSMSDSIKWEEMWSTTYVHNENGYLIQETSGSSTLIYEYEEGNGNVESLFFHPAYGTINMPFMKSGSINQEISSVPPKLPSGFRIYDLATFSGF